MSNGISCPDLLKVVYETFVGRTHLFDVFNDEKWKDTGIEHWVQTELIVALTDRGYNVTTKGKVKKDCDLLINGTALEIRTVTAPILARARGKPMLFSSWDENWSKVNETLKMAFSSWRHTRCG